MLKLGRLPQGRRGDLYLLSRKSLSSIPAFLIRNIFVCCVVKKIVSARPPKQAREPRALPNPWYPCNPWLNLLLGRSEADLNLRARVLRVYDHGLVGVHVDELVCPVAFSGCERKFLVFAHLKFLPATPGVNERGDGLRRGGDLSLHQRELRMILLVFEQQLRHIHLHPVLIPFLFFSELHDLKVGTSDHVADFQKLSWLILVDAVDAKLVFCAGRKNVRERFLGGGDQV